MYGLLYLDIKVIQINHFEQNYYIKCTKNIVQLTSSISPEFL